MKALGSCSILAAFRMLLLRALGLVNLTVPWIYNTLLFRSLLQSSVCIFRDMLECFQCKCTYIYTVVFKKLIPCTHWEVGCTTSMAMHALVLLNATIIPSCSLLVHKQGHYSRSLRKSNLPLAEFNMHTFISNIFMNGVIYFLTFMGLEGDQSLAW